MKRHLSNSRGDAALVKNARREASSRNRDANRRFLKASTLCVLLLTSMAVAIFQGNGSWAFLQAGTTRVGHVWQAMGQGKSFETAIEEEGDVILSKDGIPEWMTAEVLDETWLDGAIANNEKKVLWMRKEGSISDIRARIDNALAAKNWCVVTANEVDESTRTYIKNEGECRWILAEYVQSGNETIMVLHIERN